MQIYLREMFPGIEYEARRTKILETLETEDLFDAQDWPEDMITVKEEVVVEFKKWLDSKPTTSPRRTIVFCRNKKEAEAYQEELNTKLNESGQKDVYVGFTHDGVSLEEDAKIEQQFKTHDGHTFLLVVGRKVRGVIFLK